MKLLLGLILFALSGMSSAATKPPATALPADSLLQITDQFAAQDSQNFSLSSRRGHPQVVALFYSSCKYVCPLIIDSAKGIEQALTPAERAQLRILLVSMDPKRDTPEVLAELAATRKLDTKRWTLARTNANGVRTLAALLGVRYRALENGEFNHTSVLTLLDRQGRVLARTENMGGVPDPVFLTAVKASCAEESKESR